MNAQRFIDKLKGEISNHNHKHLLAYQTNLKFYIDIKPKFDTRQPPLIMHYRWVHKFLLNFLYAPVSASKKYKIKEIASLFEAVADGEHSDIEMDEVRPNSMYNHNYFGGFHSRRTNYTPLPFQLGIIVQRNRIRRRRQRRSLQLER